MLSFLLLSTLLTCCFAALDETPCNFQLFGAAFPEVDAAVPVVSYAEAKRCMLAHPFNATEAAETLRLARFAYSIGGFSRVNKRSGAPYYLKVDIERDLGKMYGKKYDNMYDFHDALGHVFAQTHDGHFGYNKPKCFSFLFSVPISFRVEQPEEPTGSYWRCIENREEGEDGTDEVDECSLRLYVDGVARTMLLDAASSSVVASMWPGARMEVEGHGEVDFDLSLLLGGEVIELDDHRWPAAGAISEWSDSLVFSRSAAVRFNQAIAPMTLSSTYTQRVGADVGIPESATVDLRVRHKDGTTYRVSIPWIGESLVFDGAYDNVFEHYAAACAAPKEEDEKRSRGRPHKPIIHQTESPVTPEVELITKLLSEPARVSVGPKAESKRAEPEGEGEGERGRLLNPTVIVKSMLNVFRPDGLDDTCIFSIPSFNPKALDDIQVVFNGFRDQLELCSEEGRSKIVLDVTGNGGGVVTLGINLAALLGVDIRKSFEWRELVSEFSEALVRLTPGAFDGAFADRDTRKSFDIDAISTLYTEHLWKGRLGKEDRKSKFTRPVIFASDEADVVMDEIKNGTYVPPSIDNIVILTDGRCGSTCAVFTQGLRSAGVTALGFGGFGRLSGHYGQTDSSSSSSVSSSSSSSSHSAVSTASSYSSKHSLLDAHSFAGGFIFSNEDIIDYLRICREVIDAAKGGQISDLPDANPNATIEEILAAESLLPSYVPKDLPSSAHFAVAKGVVFKQDPKGEHDHYLQPVEFAGSPVDSMVPTWTWPAGSLDADAPFSGGRLHLYTAAAHAAGRR